MVKTFEFDARKGKLIDNIQKVIPTNNGSAVVANTSKGRSITLNGTTQYLEYADNTNYSFVAEACWFEGWIINTDGDTWFPILSKRNGASGDNEFIFGLESNGYPRLLLLDDDRGGYIGRRGGSTLSKNTPHHVFATYDGGVLSSGIKVYVNGIRVDDTTVEAGAYTAMQNLGSPVFIGLYNIGSNLLGQGNVIYAAMGIGTPTLQKIQDRYNAFLNSFPIQKSINGYANFISHKSVDQEPDLVMFHNYQNGNVLDLTSNNNDGTAVAIDYTKDGVKFNGSNSKVTVGDDNSLSFGNGTSDDPFSIEWCGKINTTNNSYLINKRTDATTDAEYFLAILESGGNSLILFRLYDQSAGSYIGRAYSVASLGLYDNQELHIVATYSGNGSSSGIDIWLNGVNVDNLDSNSGSYTAMENLGADLNIGVDSATPTIYADCEPYYTKMYNTELSDIRIANKYKAIANQFVFNEDMTNQNADANASIGEWVVDSGSFKSSEDSTGKCIECVTNGAISFSGINLSSLIGNGYIKEMVTSGLSSDQGSVVDSATNVSFSGNKITVSNFTTGDKLYSLKISKGV